MGSFALGGYRRDGQQRNQRSDRQTRIALSPNEGASVKRSLLTAENMRCPTRGKPESAVSIKLTSARKLEASQRKGSGRRARPEELITGGATTPVEARQQFIFHRYAACVK